MNCTAVQYPQYANTLTRLQVLNVSSNKLSSLPAQTQADAATTLTELFVANNSLKDSVLPVVAR